VTAVLADSLAAFLPRLTGLRPGKLVRRSALVRRATALSRDGSLAGVGHTREAPAI